MRRNWLAVARKEAADASRSWLLYVLTGLLVATFGVLVFGQGLAYEPRPMPPGEPPAPETPTASMAYDDLMGMSGILVPLVALVVGYLAVAGEREAGSLRLLLGHPVTRRDVLVGKFLGRTTIVWTSLVVALGVAGAGIPVLYTGFDAAAYVGLVAMTLVSAAGFVAIAVGISAAARSRALSMGGVIATFVGTVFAWNALPRGLYFVLVGGSPGTPSPPDAVPAWFVLLRRLRPQQAFELAVHNWVTPHMWVPDGPQAVVGRYFVEGPDPFYVEPWFSGVVLLAWIVVPLALGHWRFASADLG